MCRIKKKKMILKKTSIKWLRLALKHDKKMAFILE